MIAVFVAGLAVTLMTSYVLMNQNRAHAEAALTRAVQRTSDAVAARIHLYEFGLRGARGALQVMGEQQASRHGFLTYIKTRDLDTEFPGARGFGFIRRVPASAEAAFLQKARLDGKADFKIRQLTPHEGERFVIQYIEPQDKNLAAVGLDIASEKNRREAADAAMRTGAARLTGPITLVQAKAAHDLVGQGGLAGATGAGDAKHRNSAARCCAAVQVGAQGLGQHVVLQR